MKNFFLINVILILFLISCNNDEKKDNSQQDYKVIKTIKLNSKQDSIYYSLGVVIGKQLEDYGITEINDEILLKAINDVLTENDQNLPIHPDVARQIVNAYVKDNLSQKLVAENDIGSKFLIENASKADVIELSNGIQYKEISKGTGKIPALSDNVTAHYSGKLIDGNEFVTTYDKNPVTFDISVSLKGWQEVLTIMPVGSEWEVYLPSEFAFGEKGSKNVPPNSVVIYKIKLLKIN